MASVPIIQELEPSVAKALGLLHSSDPDSEDDLYQLWKQCVYEKYGSDRTPVSVLNKINIPSGIKRESSHDVDEEFTIETKKSKLRSPPPFFQRSAPGSPQTIASAANTPIEEIDLKSSSDNDSDSNDSNREVLTGEGNCMKCKNTSFTKINKLLECIDCHKFYHQQCHFPPMLDINTNDPRFVWRCSACEQHITTTTTGERNKSSGLSSSSSKSSVSSSTSKNISSSSKGNRFGSGSSHGGSNNSGVRSSSSKSESTSKTSSSSISDKKSSHLMNKRSMKKSDKKRSSK